MTLEQDEETYSSMQVCDIVGISYRMLDYYVRAGHIVIVNDSRGSGRYRRWTHDEVLRLKRVMALVNEATDILESFRTGDLWRSAA